jgi:hypothetical protein
MWQVADDLGDAHDRDVFGPDDAAQACSFHALTAQAEEARLGSELANGVD